ncbi:MAG: extracellular solute-binding protein [Timaviella obliquedivisa GSE-PSE-MK23-08B]|jgi:putative spermidine/putrescine transport system substrate-binding protein|nr:extracellular solute-binding protein [Timaviella obliquedivisa GSE-PSE-MK23-08B]
MPTRRTFLAAATLAISQLLLACSQPRNAAQVRLLKGSVPAQILKEFQRQIEQAADLSFLQNEQLADLFSLLETWKNQKIVPSPEPSGFSLPFKNRIVPVADLVTLGDFWLTPAIQQGLIRPLDLELQWELLAPEWQTLVRRDRQGQPDPQGEIWAAPYRWSTLMIAYQPEKFESLGWVPKDWSDLWRPELKGHLSLPDSARTVIGLVLKKLGQSAHLQDLETVPSLGGELQALHQQVKFYSSDAYLQPLSLGDTWVAVGWSNEILPTINRDRSLAALVPTTGTLLTADLWVHPMTAQPNPSQADLLLKWINFCWQPEIATQLSLLSSAASPLFKGQNIEIPIALQRKPLLLPPAVVLQRSEFLLPLTPTASEQYRRQWLIMRQ